ncbi:putative hemerythrin HHE cation binding domain containing protein [Lyophyllum shimeji]|uniref:Hemerythrin HHE cation binding domain containing protein n=1 Tax=Lyophyllum shimeji TaxID=47721 RepID=A0A9P3PX65_LYOSH|nr:putative hemerythrin HHE cation binding domain containing protein [Lyophyllum shimeji]
MAAQTAPTDTYELLQWNMINAHETFKLGYDTILKHLETPPKDDLSNFLGYCEAWAQSIESHHASEEEVVFPFLNGKMDFSGEAKQHEAIHGSLEKLLDMIVEAKSKPAEFDAPKLREMMTALKEPLYTHLDEEVEHVSGARLKEAQFAERDVKVMLDRLNAYAKSHGDPFLLVPFMRSHTPGAIKDTWPGMPWILRKVVVPYMLAKRHSGYWKYSPYSMS